MIRNKPIIVMRKGSSKYERAQKFGEHENEWEHVSRQYERNETYMAWQNLERAVDNMVCLSDPEWRVFGLSGHTHGRQQV